MSKMGILESKINDMIDGDKKRRKVAIEYIEKVCDVVNPIMKHINQYEYLTAFQLAPNLYLYQRDAIDNNTVWIVTDLMYANQSCVEDIYGKDFWQCMKLLLENIYKVERAVEKTDEKIDEIISLIPNNI